MAIQVAVVGASNATDELTGAAEVVGATLASAGAVLVCGGLGGVMEAACRGAKSSGGVTVGFLPGPDKTTANRWVDISVPTAMGEGRNILVVRSAQAVIALGGEYGTLSEIALALRANIPVVGLATWNLTRGTGVPDSGIVYVDDPVEAATTALRLASIRGADTSHRAQPFRPSP
ncbi:MAG TPA: TIGR00725 family protein [Acidimicrobiales bacterium]|nr:TIGR00725 family protein [Acidimicrobiales bacterium]